VKSRPINQRALDEDYDDEVLCANWLPRPEHLSGEAVVTRAEGIAETEAETFLQNFYRHQE